MWTTKIADAVEAEEKLVVDPIILEEVVEDVRHDEAFTDKEVDKFDNMARQAVLGKQTFTVGQLRQVSFELADKYLSQVEQKA